MEVRYSRDKKKSGLMEIKTEGWEGIDPLSVDAMWQILWFDSVLSELLKHRVIKKVNMEKYLRMVQKLLEETYTSLKGLRRTNEAGKANTYIQ